MSREQVVQRKTGELEGKVQGAETVFVDVDVVIEHEGWLSREDNQQGLRGVQERRSRGATGLLSLLLYYSTLQLPTLVHSVYPCQHRHPSTVDSFLP